MKIDPQFPWWIIANTLGGIASAIVISAWKPVTQFIARWRASKLPDKSGAERRREELEGLIAEFTAWERAQIALRLLLDDSALRPETVPQVCKSSGAVLRDLTQRDKAFLNLCAVAYIRTEAPRTQSNRIKPLIPILLYMAIIHPK
jgi:hypothetical protein